MGLQPIYDSTGKKAKSYEILGREKFGDKFPFMWFAKLDKRARVQFIVRTAKFSKYLKSNGIKATFNLEMCDFKEVCAEINLSETSLEIAEFG